MRRVPFGTRVSYLVVREGRLRVRVRVKVEVRGRVGLRGRVGVRL